MAIADPRPRRIASSRQIDTASSCCLRRHAFSQGAGQIRPSTAGKAMSRLTVAMASSSSPAAIWRIISGMFMRAGQPIWHGPTQSPT